MSIIERTTKLLLTQYKGSSIKPAFLEYYTADMKKLDDYATGADNRLSALEAEDIALDGRLDTLEGWKENTVDPAISDYATRIGTLETWKTGTVDVDLADYGTRIGNLETWKTDTVTVELASLDGRVDAIEQIIHDLSIDGYYDLVARVDALEYKVNTNTTDIGTLQNNITRLDNRLSDDEALIAGLRGDMTALTNRVTTLENCCTEVRGTLNDHNTRINQNASDISALDVRLTRAETNIQGNADDIVILANQNDIQSDQIQDLYDKYNALDPSMPTNLYARVNALETIVGDEALTTTAQTLTGAVNELNSGVADNATDIGALQSTVGDNSSGLVKDVSDLQTTVGDSGSGLVKDVSDLQAIVGDSSAGLVKDVADLQTTVGDATAGLVKDVADNATAIGNLGTTVGDSNSGLVKDVGDLQTTVGDSSAGLVKDVADLDTRADKLEDANTYSNSAEVAVGKWVDNKPIYRKVVESNSFATGNALLVTGVDTLVHCEFFAHRATGSSPTWTSPFYYTTTDTLTMVQFKYDNDVPSASRNAGDVIAYIQSAGSHTYDKWYCVIEYTKL